MRKTYYVTSSSKTGSLMVLCYGSDETPVFVPIDTNPKDIITFVYKDDALDYVYRHFGDSDLEFEVPEKYILWRKNSQRATADNR